MEVKLQGLTSTNGAQPPAEDAVRDARAVGDSLRAWLLPPCSTCRLCVTMATVSPFARSSAFEESRVGGREQTVCRTYSETAHDVDIGIDRGDV